MGIIQAVKVVVHDRTERQSQRVRTYAEQRLLKVGRHFDRVMEADVDIARESRRGANSACSVQITVRMDGRRHAVAQARETGSDVRKALDLALDKVDRQVVRLKEKIKLQKKRVAVAALAADEERERDPGPRRTRMWLRPQTLAEAEAALASADHPFYVFLDESSGDVNVCYRRRDGGLGVIEAVVA